MRNAHRAGSTSPVVEGNQPDVAIPLVENGREAVRSAVETAAPATLPDSVQDALGFAGAWSDLDWDETVETLDRIRHESRPPSPIASPGL